MKNECDETRQDGVRSCTVVGEYTARGSVWLVVIVQQRHSPGARSEHGPSVGSQDMERRSGVEQRGVQMRRNSRPAVGKQVSEVVGCSPEGYETETERGPVRG